MCALKDESQHFGQGCVYRHTFFRRIWKTYLSDIAVPTFPMVKLHYISKVLHSRFWNVGNLINHMLSRLHWKCSSIGSKEQAVRHCHVWLELQTVFLYAFSRRVWQRVTQLAQVTKAASKPSWINQLVHGLEQGCLSYIQYGQQQKIWNEVAGWTEFVLNGGLYLHISQ